MTQRGHNQSRALSPSLSICIPSQRRRTKKRPQREPVSPNGDGKFFLRGSFRRTLSPLKPLKRAQWVGNEGNMELSDSPKLSLVLIWEEGALEEVEAEAAFWRAGLRLLTRLARLPLLLLRSVPPPVQVPRTYKPSTHVRGVWRRRRHTKLARLVFE